MTRTLLCIAGLCLLPGLAFDGVWLRGEIPYAAGILEEAHLPWSRMQPAGSVRAANPVLSDSVYQMLPWDRVARRGWQGAGPALWNPHGGLGASMIGNPQSVLFDPVRLVSTAASARRAPLLRSWLRLILAGLLAFGLLRSLGCARSGAFLGASAFEVGGFLMAWLSHPLAGTAIFLPGVLWAGDRFLRGRGRGPFTALVLLYGAQFLAGNPESSLHLTTLAGVFWGVRRLRAGWKAWLGVGGGLVLGALLAAPMLFPFIQYLAGSAALETRSAGPGEVTLPVRALAAFGIPRLFGWPLEGGDWRGALNACESIAYIGLVPWLLAPFAFFDPRHRRTALALSIAGAFSAAAVVGLPGLQQVLSAVPGFAWAANRRLLLGIAFAGAMLGGLGLDAILRRAKDMPSLAWWLAGGVVAGAAVGAAAAGAEDGGGWAAFRACPIGWLAFGAQSILVLTLLRLILRRRVAVRWCALLLPMLLVDLSLAWRGFQPTAPSGALFATAPSVEAIRARARPEDRVLTVPVPGRGLVFPPNTLQSFGLSGLFNYDALGDADVRERLAAAVSVPQPARLAADELNVFGHRFVAAGTTWERLHAAARLLPGRAHTVVFPADGSAAAVVLHSYLVGGESYAARARVAELTVRACHPDGRTEDHTVWVRAGVETAEAAVPQLGPAVAHPAAAVAETFRVRDACGRPYPRFVFHCRVAWPAERGRPVGARIRFTGDRGYLEVDGLGLERDDGTTTLDARLRPFFAGELRVYENPYAWPRAFLAPAASLGGDALPSRDRIRAASIRRYEPDRVVVDGEAREGEVLVLTDACAPGWAAAVEAGGTSVAAIERAYGLFRAVRVEPGRFSVTFSYRPGSFRLGLAAAAAGVVLLAACLILRRPVA